ncbi:MAG: flagellar protein FlaG [Kordiimonas sp.]
MTEVSNIKSGGEVINLKPANVRAPESNGAGSIAASGGAATAVAISPRETESLVRGEDPLVKAAETIQEFVPQEGPETELRIDKDDETGRFVYKSVDKESGEVIKQFPPETILELISQYRSLEGLVVDDDA